MDSSLRGKALASTLAVAALLAAALALPTSSPAQPAPPSCAEGPVREGDTIEGTPCADRIVVPAAVTYVDGGAGDDTIIGARSGAAITGPCPAGGCHLLVGSQTFEGGPGDDVVFGDRGNDTLRGNGGDDRLYGGIGDDVLEGGPGNDILSGGFGADKIDGGEGNDYVRGDPTIDHIFDTGGGFDTLSFATGATPGFKNPENDPDPTEVANFPGEEGERGVWLRLDQGGNNALDGEPSLGGGNDEVQSGVFERIIGTPFSDYIVGSSAAEEIWGGGGADVIEGGGGADVIHGGADGDFIEASAGSTIDGEAGNDNCLLGGAATPGCEGTAKAVALRDTAKVSVGETIAAAGLTQVYLVGSSGADAVTATYDGSGNVEFTLTSGSFDTSATDAGGCTVSATTASCPVSGLLDAILLAGMGGNDSIAADVPDGVGVFELGGSGEDHLLGSGSEDVLVDGPGASRDVLEAGAGDDALTHNGGADLLDGGQGSDLFLSVSICDGETIDGGAESVGAAIPDRDNASWARLATIGVDARLDQGRVGRVSAGGEPQCPGNDFDTLSRIEDLEASNQDDYLVGNGANNQILGHKGHDSYFALGGQDTILANSGSQDVVIDCGADLDQAVIDIPTEAFSDPTPIECESVRQGNVEEFRELELLEPPPPPPPPPDTKPPRTRITHRPPRMVLSARVHRRVSFRFASSEAGSTFFCKLDARPYRRCRSPRTFGVGLGAHVVRIYAVDAAGNRDRTPVVFRFQLRLKPHPPRGAR